MKAAYLNATEVAAKVESAEPQITTAEADAAVSGIAASAVSDPVSVEVADKGKLTLKPDVIAASLTFEPKDGCLLYTSRCV